MGTAERESAGGEVMTVGSLFSGIGGFDLGLERAGLEVRWQVEIDPFCRRVLAQRWPDVARYEDVREVDGHAIEREHGSVDVICGGFPCQDLSVAGRRAGLAGERSGLFFEFMRIVDELRPRWVVIENVPGLRSSWSPDEQTPSELEPGRTWETDETSDLGIVVSTLAELGYLGAYRSLDCQYFGLAQRRERVFIVGSFGTLCAAEVLFERDSRVGDSPPSRETGTELARDVAAGLRGAGGGPRGFHLDNESGLTVTSTLLASGAGTSRTAGIASEVDFLVCQVEITNQGSGGNVGYASADAPTFTLSTGGPSGVMVAHKNLSASDGGADDNHAQAGHLVARALTSRNQRLDGDTETFVVAPTLSTKNEVASSSTQREKWMEQSASMFGLVRRLTPRECERLQGFPDDWTAVDGESTPDSPRYRAIGNAVAVPVAEWIGRQMLVGR